MFLLVLLSSMSMMVIPAQVVPEQQVASVALTLTKTNDGIDLGVIQVSPTCVSEYEATFQLYHAIKYDGLWYMMQVGNGTGKLQLGNMVSSGFAGRFQAQRHLYSFHGLWLNGVQPGLYMVVAENLTSRTSKTCSSVVLHSEVPLLVVGVPDELPVFAELGAVVLSKSSSDNKLSVEIGGNGPTQAVVFQLVQDNSGNEATFQKVYSGDYSVEKIEVPMSAFLVGEPLFVHLSDKHGVSCVVPLLGGEVPVIGPNGEVDANASLQAQYRRLFSK
ncbi:MAG: hypothetical protein AAB350_00200 [Patescibacteria group bacterium]